MKFLDSEPTRQQLENLDFLKSLPPEGAIYDDQQYGAICSFFKDGEKLKFMNSDGTETINAFHHDHALDLLDRMERHYGKLEVRITGHYQTSKPYDLEA